MRQALTICCAACKRWVAQTTGLQSGGLCVRCQGRNDTVLESRDHRAEAIGGRYFCPEGRGMCYCLAGVKSMLSYR